MYSVKSLDGYDAAVLGSAVNRGKWLPVAEYFVETYQKKLSAIPVALFSVHSTMLENDEVAIRKRQSILRNIRPLLHSTAEGYFPAQNNLRTGGQVLPGFVSWTAVYKAFLNDKDIRLWANSLFQMEFSRISTSLGQNEKPTE
jgi:hypothetical protein